MWPVRLILSAYREDWAGIQRIREIINFVHKMPVSGVQLYLQVHWWRENHQLMGLQVVADLTVETAGNRAKGHRDIIFSTHIHSLFIYSYWVKLAWYAIITMHGLHRLEKVSVVCYRRAKDKVLMLVTMHFTRFAGICPSSVFSHA